MITPIKLIIVDDETIAREILETYISKVSYLDLCGSFSNGIDAISYIDKHNVDLVLLDIHMPDLDGFSVKEILSKHLKVIFTTAHRTYALKGFEVNALDYLLKPISFERFLKAIQKYTELNTSQPQVISKVPKHIFIRSDRKMLKVNLNEICYIESFSDYLKIHTVNQKLVTRETISNLESKLPKQTFLRCHRSYIVALDKITAYTNEYLELERITIPISRSYKADVLSFLEGS